MKACRFGDTFYQISHGPPVLARNSFSIWSSCCVCPIYPAWCRGSGMLHVIDCCGQMRNIERLEGLEGTKWRTVEIWEVKRELGCFPPSSIWYSSRLRESWHPFVIHCMLRNNGSHQFGQSSIAVIMHLDLLLLWTKSAEKKSPNLTRWELINNFLQLVLRIDWMSFSWTLFHWDTEIFLILDETGEGGASCTYLRVSKSLILGLNNSVGGKWVRLI